MKKNEEKLLRVLIREELASMKEFQDSPEVNKDVAKKPSKIKDTAASKRVEKSMGSQAVKSAIAGIKTVNDLTSLLRNELEMISAEEDLEKPDMIKSLTQVLNSLRSEG